MILHLILQLKQNKELKKNLKQRQYYIIVEALTVMH